MKIHKENCPIYLSLNGKWSSSMSPYCACDGFTQSSGTGIQENHKENKKKIYKTFRCRGCYQSISVPIEFGGEIICEHDKFNTGSIKDLVDIYEKE